MIPLDPPKQVRIRDAVYSRFAATLTRIGLPRQEFRVVEEGDDVVVVDPRDLSSPSKDGPFFIRRDIIEFPTEEN